MEAPNPFYERGPVRDPKRFFGRESELRQVFARLINMQSVSIVGERRIGKSSLLAVITATGRDRLGQDYEFYTIDLQRVESTEDFFARALDALDVTDGKGARDFEKALDGRKVVLCLDEFEQAGSFSKEFFNVMRSLASTGHLALVTASKRTLAELSQEDLTTSAFFNIFTTLPLGEMNQDEAAELLDGLAGKQFPAKSIEAAYAATRGNPWKLQIFGYYLVQAKDADTARQQYNEEIERSTKPESVAAVKGLVAESVEPETPPPVERNQASSILLILAATLGIVSLLFGFSLGLGLAVGLTLLSLLVEGLFRFRHRSQDQ
jgi:uncharacterized protein